MANTKPENVLVIIIADSCSACQRIKNHPHLYKDAVKDAKVGVRAEIVKSPIDQNLFPTDLIRFSAKTPTFLLVRGDVWEASKQHLGINNPVKFDTSVGLDIEIMPDGRVNRPLGNTSSVNFNDQNKIVEWLKEAVKLLATKQTNLAISPKPIPVSVPVTETNAQTKIIPDVCTNIRIVSKQF